jgi:hypothetical protein
MRVVSFMLITLIFGSAVGYATGLDPFVASGVIGILSFVPLGIGNDVLCSLVGDHTGAVSYGGSVESPIARFHIKGTAAAVATLLATKLTISQATKRKTGTMIPELTLSQLADIAGFIDAMILKSATTLEFSLPISLGGAYDLEGGSLTYNLTDATAGDVVKIYAIDDAKRELDYIDIVPIGCTAGGVKSLDAIYGTFMFIDPTNLTRIKIIYANGLAIEYLGAEISEICRVVNPVHQVTDAGVLTSGYGTLGGINIVDATKVEVTLTAAGTVYMVKHMLAG